MKKLDYNHLTTGALTVDASHLIGVVNDLIDLVNSQQEAIGELQTEIGVLRNMVLQSQEAIEELEKELSLRPIGAEIIDKGWTGESVNEVVTHRTVTLRIPKGMRVGEAMYEVWTEIIGDSYGILEISDTDLQKALDEVKK